MMKNQEVKKSIETKDNESGYLQPCHSRLTAQDRICPADSSSRKAMNLNETEDAPSSERRILGGIGESRNRDSESGRSMVEMLGVLAIMGVLAIGGIAGYRWAMDKYNANEILNEVRKRAVTASQQRILGQTINLSEYGNNTIQGHTVTTADSYNGDTSFFALTVSGIEKGVCDQVIKDKILFVVEEKIGDVVIEEETVCAEGENNDITFVFKNTLEEDVDLKCEGITCPEGTSCAAGWCLCPNGWEKCGDICCAAGEICTTSGIAESSQCYISEGECTRNEDCKTPDGRVDTTKYCAFENPVSSVHPGEGTCQDKGAALPEKCVAWRGKDGETVYTLEEAGENPVCTWKTYGKGGLIYTFWSAKNMCLAHGKKMLDISNNRLKCFNPNAGVSGGKYCCESSYNDCGGYFITEGKSKQAAAFMRAYRAGEFWVAPDYTDEKSFYVSFVDAAIHLRSRKGPAGLLCE